VYVISSVLDINFTVWGVMGGLLLRYYFGLSNRSLSAIIASEAYERQSVSELSIRLTSGSSFFKG